MVCWPTVPRQQRLDGHEHPRMTAPTGPVHLVTTFFYRPEAATGPLAGAAGVQVECKDNNYVADISGVVHEGTLENVKNELDMICQRVDYVDLDNELHQLEQQMQKLIENLDGAGNLIP